MRKRGSYSPQLSAVLSRVPTPSTAGNLVHVDGHQRIFIGFANSVLWKELCFARRGMALNEGGVISFPIYLSSHQVC